MTGEIIGKVMFQNVAQELAPSTFAASYSSVGTPCNPASMISMAFPTPQMPMMTYVGYTQLTSFAHSGKSALATPKNNKTRLIHPVSELSIPPHRKTLATKGTINGI